MITEKEILNKYPKIFKDRFKPMTETCMCWGLEVPDEWLPVIDEMCETITNYGYNTYAQGFEGMIDFPQVVAEQVKEKFNGFRFYYRLEYKQEGVPEKIIRDHYKFIDGIITHAEMRIDKIENEGVKKKNILRR